LHRYIAGWAAMNDPSRTTLSEADLQVWREAMAQLRHLSDDLFKSVKFFSSLNAALLMAVTFFIGFEAPGAKPAWLYVGISILGIALTLGARFLLRRHRIYYLEMLARKSLLEMEFGFYDRKFSGTEIDFALPWRLKPEVVREIAKDLDGWVQKSIRSKGTMVRLYFWLYEAFIAIYAVLLVAALRHCFS
jgi:hypothetical protein